MVCSSVESAAPDKAKTKKGWFAKTAAIGRRGGAADSAVSSGGGDSDRLAGRAGFIDKTARAP